MTCEEIFLNRKEDEKMHAANSQTTVKTQPKVSAKRMTQIAMLSAAATILMYFEVPLPFAPPFYKIDFSEVPVLVGAFAIGPMAGVLIELVKVMLHALIKGSASAGIGTLANFLIGACMVVPAGLVYKKKHTKKGALIGLSLGTAAMTVGGCFLNAYVLLPFYAKAFGMPIEALIGMGTKVNASIKDMMTFVLFAVAPFNLVKGICVSLVVLIIYKSLSPIFKMARN